VRLPLGRIPAAPLPGSVSSPREKGLTGAFRLRKQTISFPANPNHTTRGGSTPARPAAFSLMRRMASLFARPTFTPIAVEPARVQLFEQPVLCASMFE